ncbi:MAG TPA: hypothetical protein VN924_17435 [Bryobacteraceae bacterium]|nr:hypothetical protein [Bryobacteraceae bacterium]
MKRGWGAYALFVSVSLFPGMAHAQYCGPTTFTGNQFPKGNFFGNFDNSCYLIPFTTGTGASSGGDLNSIYAKIFYKVNPAYQLIVVGTFPNARYFSITDYDMHSAPAQFIVDQDIVPLTSSYINTFEPGVAFAANQRYAVPIDFEGTPGTQQTGCLMNGYNVTVNALDATFRHAAMDWNSDPSVWKANPSFTPHIVDTPEHTNPNAAGVIMARTYLPIAGAPPPTPYVIVRDVASGCAYPAAYALQVLGIVTTNSTTGNAWLDSNQAELHRVYANDYLPQLCYAYNPQAMLQFVRGVEYVPGAIPDGSYVTAPVASGEPATLAANQRVMRIRFQMPTTPPTPCTNGCSISGNEQLRYMSLSFMNPGGATLASLADNYFTRNSSGDVTLIVGTGATDIPSWITPANGYTFFDLTTVSGYLNLSELDLRNFIPASAFNCAGEIVPWGTGEYTPGGGLMGQYSPFVDYPLAASLETVAGAPPATGACDVFPDGQAGLPPSCGVVTPKPIAITALSTQCAAPGSCAVVYVQPQPPLSIIGGGFGDFPNGLPFVGTSNYLQITDNTQGWSAGYSGDACTVSIYSWAANLIELVANVDQNGLCPMAAGDSLTVTVWNPQSVAYGPSTSATFPTTVQSY